MKRYEKNIAILKKLRNDYFKILVFKSLRLPDAPKEKPIEPESTDIMQRDTDMPKKLRGNSNGKLSESLSRSRSRVFEIATCNNFEYFITLTINANKQSRSDLKIFYKRLSKWINNYNSRNNTTIKYLIIPELHRDNNNWHFHGLIKGLPEEHLTAFTLHDNIPKRMEKLIRDGRELYNWTAYSDTFGFVSVEKIRNHDAAARYITKYITKNIGNKIDLNDNVYYCSQGLSRATEVFRGDLRQDFEPDYMNKYVSIKVLSNEAEAFSYFADDNEPP